MGFAKIAIKADDSYIRSCYIEFIYGGVLEKLFYVAACGSFGSLSRYEITFLSVKLFSDHFPAETLIVNLPDCFLISLIFALGSSVILSAIIPSFLYLLKSGRLQGFLK